MSKLKELAAEVLERSAATDAAEDARHVKAGTGLDLHPLWADPCGRPDLIKDAVAQLPEEDRHLTESRRGIPCDVGGDGLEGRTRSECVPVGAPAPAARSTEVVPAGPAMSTELVREAGSRRARRFAAEKDARVLAALASVLAQEAVRDAVVREPRVAKAEARLVRMQARVGTVRARLQAHYVVLGDRMAARGGPDLRVPVEEHSTLLSAKAQVVRAEMNLVAARESGRRPSKQIDPSGNLTDPDSRRMRCSGGGYLQGYNGQLAVTDDHLILVAAISQSASDMSSGIPMMCAAVAAVEKLDQATGSTGLAVGTFLLDAGYCSIDIITAPGPDRLIATGRTRELKAAADSTDASTRPPGEPSEVMKMT